MVEMYVERMNFEHLAHYGPLLLVHMWLYYQNQRRVDPMSHKSSKNHMLS